MAAKTLALTEGLREYIGAFGPRLTPLEERLRIETQSFEKSDYQISPEQAGLLRFLILSTKPNLCVEIGVFTGLSSLVVAQCLMPGAKLLCCDTNTSYTDVAQRYWKEAGVEDRVELTHSDGISFLEGLLTAGLAGKVDYLFVDANKEAYGSYYEIGLQLLRPGGLLVIDNVFRQGKVALPEVLDAGTEAVKKVNSLVAAGSNPFAMIPIGDGVTLILKS